MKNLYKQVIGRMAQNNLWNYVSKDIKVDKTFGIRTENDNDSYISNQPICIIYNNIQFNYETKFTGTVGL